MSNPDELADAIEATREHNKNLWQDLARLLEYDFKAERRHNDIIVAMLRTAGKSTDPVVKDLLRAISGNDRKISDLVGELAESENNA